MGVSKLEARLLSSQTGAEKVSRPLRDAASIPSEVNFTFRQLVKETTIQNWIEQTPASFRFGVKAHQVITHIKRLKGTEEFLPRFLATIEPLARAGQAGSRALPVAAEFEGRCCAARGFSSASSAEFAGGI